MKTRILSIAFILFWMCTINAQSLDLFVIASAGNYMSNQDFSISATMGELMTETYSIGEIILTQGFQQSGLTIKTNIDETGMEWNILIFPNPVTDELNMDFYGDYLGKIGIELFDMKGRKIMHQSIEKGSFRYVYTLHISSIEKGVYILKITTSDYRLHKISRIEIQ